MRLPTALAALALSATPALADRPLGGNVDSMGITFNATAKDHGFAVRVGDAECETGQVTVCRYNGDGGVHMLAASTQDGKTLRFIMLVFGGDSFSADRMTESLGVLSMIHAPLASPDEIGRAASNVIDAAISGKEGEVRLRNIAFMPSTRAGAIIVGVERR